MSGMVLSSALSTMAWVWLFPWKPVRPQHPGERDRSLLSRLSDSSALLGRPLLCANFFLVSPPGLGAQDPATSRTAS